MKVDSIFAPAGMKDLSGAGRLAAASEEAGFDGIWSAEVDHDPFFPLIIAAEHTTRVALGTGIAVALARSPMTLATIGNDLQLYSRGRFMLGLGSQVRAHVTKRFSMPWSQPARRMRELIVAMRAIWSCWNDGTNLDFRGDFYQHTLMTPMFNPGPNPYGAPKVFLAAVGAAMTQVAGEVADGLLVHALTTERYLRERSLPAMERGLSASGRDRSNIEVSVPPFVVTGRNDDEMEASAARVRGQIAFYASTPAYLGVLSLHGWAGLQPELHRLSKQGEWRRMGELIDDEMLDTFAIVAREDEVAERVVKRFGGLADRITFVSAGAGSATPQAISTLKERASA